MPGTAVRTAVPRVASDHQGRRYAFNPPAGMRSTVVALTRAGNTSAPRPLSRLLRSSGSVAGRRLLDRTPAPGPIGACGVERLCLRPRRTATVPWEAAMAGTQVAAGTTRPDQAPAVASRLGWMDTLRVTAIAGVIVMHAAT